MKQLRSVKKLSFHGGKILHHKIKWFRAFWIWDYELDAEASFDEIDG